MPSKQRLKVGQGRIDVYPMRDGDASDDAPAKPWRFSTGLHCPDCDVFYKEPSPSTFSFNSPIGACDTCRGFGRSIGVDYGLVIPDTALSLRQGAIKPWQTESYKECQSDLLKFARKREVPIDTPWRDLTDAQRAWVIEGEGEWTKNVWYGVRRFFAWLETSLQDIRVLLSRHCSYRVRRRGSRLKPDAAGGSAPGHRYSRDDVVADRRSLEVFDCPAAAAARWAPTFARHPRRLAPCDVGPGYLNLDRQSRTYRRQFSASTHHGVGHFAGQYAVRARRTIDRITSARRRASSRDARLRVPATLVVVEHDPKVIQRGSRARHRSGPAARGEIVFYGSCAARRQGFAHGRLSIRRAQAWRAGRGGAHPRCVAHVRRPTQPQAYDVAIPLHGSFASPASAGRVNPRYSTCCSALRAGAGPPRTGRTAPDRRELIDDVIMVIRCIGRTTRSNPRLCGRARRRPLCSQSCRRPATRTRPVPWVSTPATALPTCGGNGLSMSRCSSFDVLLPDCDRRFRAGAQ